MGAAPHIPPSGTLLPTTRRAHPPDVCARDARGVGLVGKRGAEVPGTTAGVGTLRARVCPHPDPRRMAISHAAPPCGGIPHPIHGILVTPGPLISVPQQIPKLPPTARYVARAYIEKLAYHNQGTGTKMNPASKACKHELRVCLASGTRGSSSTPGTPSTLTCTRLASGKPWKIW